MEDNKKIIIKGMSYRELAKKLLVMDSCLCCDLEKDKNGNLFINLAINTKFTEEYKILKSKAKKYLKVK